MRSYRFFIGFIAFVSVTLSSVSWAQVIGQIGSARGAGPHEPRPSRPHQPSPQFPGSPGLPGFPDFPGFPGSPESPDYSEQREIYVGRYLRDETLPLERLLRLSETSYGRQIESVIVHLRDARRGSIALMMDYNQVDFRSFPSDVEVLRPRYGARVGIDFQSLGLRIMDRVYVESVIVNFAGGGHYPPNPGGGYGNVEIERDINQSFNGLGQLDLGQVMGLYRYQGFQLQSVEITGGANGSPLPIAFIALIANGSEQGRTQFLGQFAQVQSISMSTPLQIGRDLNSLALAFVGDVRIDRIRFKLVRAR